MVAAQHPHPKIVAIVGETASGKSALGLELAVRFNGEIIAADSWTVRRGLNIGTAKPTAEEKRRVPHHLLDIVEACEPFSAAIFKRLAERAITDIAKRAKLPIIIGGTGLYVDSVLFNYSFMDQPSVTLRQQLNAKSIPQLLRQINQRNLDLTGIDTRNKRRLIRLIETNGASPKRARSCRPNSLVLGVRLDRTELRNRIERRVDAMLKLGLKREVKELAELYGWDCEGLKGIGYREWQPYFESKLSNSEVRRKIIKSTLELAKRQRTWFKRNRQIQWVATLSEAVDLTQQFLKLN